MGIRRKSREAAFQLLYQLDLADMTADQSVEEFWSQMGIPHQARQFTQQLVSGSMENRDKIDDLISSNSHHWKIHRMNSVDKCVLRLGVYELMFCPETPTKVIINEAIEIGKKFGTGESGSFINGILDKISKEVRSDEKEK
jgi:N utilization substance protein B